MEKYILIVDDEPSILDALQLMLEYEGFNVQTTQKGEYAEKMPQWSDHYPKLIIMDMYLSGKDGCAITQKLKKSQKTKNIPIMMISAHPEASYRAKKVGADEFLPKPFEYNELVHKVRKYVS